MAFQETLNIEGGSPRRQTGCYISRFYVGIIIVAFIGTAVITGVVVARVRSSAPCIGAEEDKGSDNNTDTEKPQRLTDVRLPTHLVPTSYNVRLLPFIEEGNFTFDGHVTITLEATRSANNITVHVKDMLIKNDSVEVKDTTEGKSMTITGYKYDNEREFFIILLGKETAKDHVYQVSISFTGNLNDKLVGFYRSSYTDGVDKTKWLAVTQFAPTDARRAFPCLDEPALKAKFNITLGRRSQMKSVSNMPIERSEQIQHAPGYMWDIFKPTVPMSTYLVAFLVSDFDMKVADSGVNKTLFRLWSRPSAVDKLKYASSIGPDILTYFEKFFKIKYPLPKQDMIAIPDFLFGAMENWGIITYRETTLLYKEDDSSAVNKQRVAVVVSHELAHQWFGNLVTPSWWTDLWLKEGFASYVEYLGVEKVEPEWKMMEQFIIMDLQRVMNADALETSHPISIVVHDPLEIYELYDIISYQKGASIIRMMDHYLTSDTLRNGLENYLRKKQYQAATQDDLWASLSAQAHVDKTLPGDLTVKTIMDTWTLQMGYPVVKVERNYSDNSAMLEQTRFLLNGNQAPDSFLWWIPISYTGQKELNFKETKPMSWMPKIKAVQLTDMPSSDQWVIFNVQETGYYKVNYDQRNWDMIVKQLKRNHTDIHTINRAQLIDDSMDLARAGKLEYDTALSIVGYLEKEADYVPWQSAFSNLGYLSAQFKKTSSYGMFKQFILKLINSRYQNIGFDQNEDETHLQRLSRSSVLSWACAMGHPDCIQRSKTLFAQLMARSSNVSSIPADRRYLVYCTAIEHGGQKEWEFAWEKYRRSTIAAEKARLLRAMSCTRETWLLNRYLNMILEPKSDIRAQDGPGVFQDIFGSTVGHSVAWMFLNNNLKQIIEVYGRDGSIPKRFVAALKGTHKTDLELKQLERFMEDNKNILGESQRTLQQAIEGARNNVAWMNDNYGKITSWLKTRTS